MVSKLLKPRSILSIIREDSDYKQLSLSDTSTKHRSTGIFYFGALEPPITLYWVSAPVNTQNRFQSPSKHRSHSTELQYPNCEYWWSDL